MIIMPKKAEVAKEVKAKLQEDKKQQEKAVAEAEEKTEAKVDKKAETKPEKKAETKKPEAKQAKAPEKKEEKKIEEVLEEKIIILPLRDAWKFPRKKRAKAAITVLREQLQRHIKKEIKLDMSVNRAIWKHGIANPPRKIKVNVKVMKDSAKAYFIE